MNKLPITSNTTTASVISTDNSEVSKLDLAGNQPFAAKHIQISNDKLKMDVAIDGRWQTIQLALKPPTQPKQIAEAQVSIDETGKVVTFQTPKLQAQVTLTKQLFDILSTLKVHTQGPVLNVPATTSPDSMLHIKSLDLKVPIPQAMTQMLTNEGKLFAQLSPRQGDFALQIVNQFNDPLFNTVLPKSMVAKLISTQLSQVEFKQQAQAITLNVNDRPIALKPVASNWPVSSAWQKGEVKTAFNGLDITKAAQLTKVETIKPISSLLQQVTPISSKARQLLPQSMTSVHTLAYEKPLLEVSLQQIKSQVVKALQVLLSRPFGQAQASQQTTPAIPAASIAQSAKPNNNTMLQPLQTEKVSAHNRNQLQSPLQQLVSNLKHSVNTLIDKPTYLTEKGAQPATQAKLASSIAHYLQNQSNTVAKYSAPPVDFTSKLKAISLLLDSVTAHRPPLNTQQVAQLAQVLQKPLYYKAEQVAQLIAQTAAKPTYLKAQTNIDAAKLSQPIVDVGSQAKQTNTPASSVPANPNTLPALPLTSEKLAQVTHKGLIETLLNAAPPKPTESATTTTSVEQVSKIIQALSKTESQPSNPALQKLVNQAFSRLLDERTINALSVKNQLESQLGAIPFTNAPTNLNQSSFSQMLERLIVSLLGGQATSSNTAGEQTAHKVQALLDTLLPQLKTLSPKQAAEAMQQPQARELLNELGQLHNQLQPQQQQTSSANIAKQDSEAQLLINLLFPTKVNQQQQQTQLQIGEYKKATKPGMPEKSVWFIRLCFDFAEKGQIHAQAELMDKALECALVATSNQVKQLAEPHLATLRHKLASHGLQVAEIGLSEEASFQDKFFSEHAIINIKV
ncbi:flagellar hook-length control protein FliK [Pseudoalteromonas piscicida]|uniref:Flagellar hook-length control protein FliK n=1 Tax=Pseudoalteromonas piscicida TaxID=43662 RepID=A0A2A5JV58_PSEO7|nr:flagellar hook-length control protein FliK [Pseudoalteromonas piscicida]PCK33362.1 flagellar hook-length control protein FliK [Pseudoalteromonas piscicida]